MKNKKLFSLISLSLVLGVTTGSSPALTSGADLTPIKYKSEMVQPGGTYTGPTVIPGINFNTTYRVYIGQDWPIGRHTHFKVTNQEYLGTKYAYSLSTKVSTKNIDDLKAEISEGFTFTESLSITKTIDARITAAIAKELSFVDLVKEDVSLEGSLGFSYSETKTYVSSLSFNITYNIELNDEFLKTYNFVQVNMYADFYSLRTTSYDTYDYWWDHNSKINNSDKTYDIIYAKNFYIQIDGSM